MIKIEVYNLMKFYLNLISICMYETFPIYLFNQYELSFFKPKMQNVNNII